MRKRLTGIHEVFTTIILTLVIFFVAVFAGKDSPLSELLLNLFLGLICISPLAILGIIVIRIGTLSKAAKRKREFMPLGDYDDARLEHIMSKLSP